MLDYDNIPERYHEPMKDVDRKMAKLANSITTEHKAIVFTRQLEHFSDILDKIKEMPI